ncbi:MAG TPA: hypothetical protein VH951_12640 [Dehalococcoidia bacterium]|jgi:hypothetical protein
MLRGNSGPNLNGASPGRIDPAAFRACDAESQRLLLATKMCLDDMKAQLTDVTLHLALLKASLTVPAEFLKGGQALARESA